MPTDTLISEQAASILERFEGGTYAVGLDTDADTVLDDLRCIVAAVDLYRGEVDRLRGQLAADLIGVESVRLYERRRIASLFEANADTIRQHAETLTPEFVAFLIGLTAQPSPALEAELLPRLPGTP